MLRKLIGQLQEQTDSTLHESEDWTEKYRSRSGPDHWVDYRNKNLNRLLKRIDQAFTYGKAAVSDGYFLTAIAQKDVLSSISTAIEEIGSWVKEGQDAAFDYKNAPRGLSEKGTQTFVNTAKKIFKSSRDTELEMMTELTKLRIAVAALEVNKSKKPLSKSAMEKDEREKKAKTCQICGGKYLAEKGLIAHHGYQRPGWGYQTASCYGARYLPFQESRDRLGEWIERLESMLVDAEKELKFVKTSPELVLTGTRGAYGGNKHTMKVKVTADNFDEMLADMDKALRDKITDKYASTDFNAGSNHYGNKRSFDQLRKIMVANAESQVRAIKSDLEMQNRRYDGWKPQTAEG
jgi:hypothetical protein